MQNSDCAGEARLSRPGDSIRPFFVALIAACNRPTLLADRALPSVAAQLRRPDLLLVVDDSRGAQCEANRRAVDAFARNGIPALYTTNTRGAGAAGAWNTGAFVALRQAQHPDSVYLAILDDDDAWLDNHLSQVEQLIRARNPDVLATPFIRREDAREKIIAPPPSPNWRDFLAGNPGIQGSNLVVRLSTFLRAGMFDETLQACTDRDVCLRLFLCGASFVAAREVSVIHHATDSIRRLSNYADARRLAGLSAFANKYRHWMHAEEWRIFCGRARKLFGWESSARREEFSPAGDAKAATNAAADTSSVDEPLALVVGVIVDFARGDPTGLFDDLLQLTRHRGLASLDVVVLSAVADDSRLMQEVKRRREAGMRVYAISRRRASELAMQLGISFDADMRPISVNRTLLQYHVGRLAQTISPRAVCWILDDDVRLHALDEEGRSYRPDYIDEIIRLRDADCDIAVGGVDGDAPLPRSLTVRTQLLDLLHCVAAEMHNETPAKRNVKLDALTAQAYYHDCIAHLFLESPVGAQTLVARYEGAVLRRISDVLQDIFAGRAVSRPLISAARADANAVPHRGGNTLVFASDALLDFPNGFATPEQMHLRRSDDIWCTLNKRLAARRITAGNFAVVQDRGRQQETTADRKRLAYDICGRAFAGALAARIGQCRDDGMTASPPFDAAFVAGVRELVDERMAALTASFFRIQGLLCSLQNLLETNGGASGVSNSVRAALRKMKREFSPAVITQIRKQNESLLAAMSHPKTNDDCRRFLGRYANLPRVDGRGWTKWRRDERRQNAAALLRKLHPEHSALRYLGGDDECSVFQSDGYLMKVLHHWRLRRADDDAASLPRLLGKLANSRHFSPLLAWRHDGADSIAAMPYQETSPYRGGHAASMVSLLADMRKFGVVHWNLAPKNLRLRDDEVQVIDYGADIRAYTAAGFDAVVRKAWLCCFWHSRRDLPALLSASRTRPDLPQLAGWRRMKKAAIRFAAHSYCGDHALRLIACDAPATVLDYGCGKGKIALQLQSRGMATAAYDIEYAAGVREKLTAAGVSVFADERALLANKFDAVLCRKVLCEIHGEAELRRALFNLRRLVCDSGFVVVSYCDPNGIAHETPHATNNFPHDADFNACFAYSKVVRQTGATRRHYYRPERIIRHEIARAGFRITRRASCPDIDLASLKNCAGSITYRLQPLP